MDPYKPKLTRVRVGDYNHHGYAECVNCGAPLFNDENAYVIGESDDMGDFVCSKTCGHREIALQSPKNMGAK